MRCGDRYEAVVVLFAAVLVLLLIPFAAAYGTATHTRLEQQTRATRAAIHQVSAVLLEDPHPVPGTTEGSLRSAGQQDSATVRWSTSHGERTAVVPTDGAATAGQTISISVGADGNLAGSPRTSGQDAVVAVTAACGVWALGSGGILLVPVLVHLVLNRNRMRQWAREWIQLDNRG